MISQTFLKRYKQQIALLSLLSHNEYRVLEQISDGLSTREIANNPRNRRSVKTIESVVESLKNKLAIASTKDLRYFAILFFACCRMLGQKPLIKTTRVITFGKATATVESFGSLHG